MDEKVRVEMLTEALKEVGEIYLHEVTDEMNEVAKEVAEELRKNIRRDAPRGYRRKYYRYGRIKQVDARLGARNYVWYIAKPEYRIGHLLEWPHRKARGGGMTRARPHIKKNEEKANDKFYKRCVEIIKRGGK